MRGRWRDWELIELVNPNTLEPPISLLVISQMQPVRKKTLSGGFSEESYEHTQWHPRTNASR